MTGIVDNPTGYSIRKLARKALLWSGLGSGIALTLVFAFLARSTHANTRGLIFIMIAINLAMLVPWKWQSLPQWLHAPFGIARGFHWVINLMFGCFGLLLLTHAGQPKRAVAFGVLSLMFVLWAAAARRLTRRDPV